MRRFIIRRNGAADIVESETDFTALEVYAGKAGFASVADAADAAGQTIAEYCDAFVVKEIVELQIDHRLYDRCVGLSARKHVTASELIEEILKEHLAAT